MKNTGNTASNRTLNPRNVKPSIPLDPDEVDGAMEKFIRQKYQHKKLAGDTPVLNAIHNTGSTTSTDDRPPPPPPKPLARLGPGLRTTSATFPSALVGGPPNPAQPSRLGWSENAPPVYGGQQRGRRRSSFDGKLVHLRQIGFRDGEQNLTVLKGVDGDVQRAVEVLRQLSGGQQVARVPGVGINATKTREEQSAVISSNPYQRPRPGLSTVNSASFEQNQALPPQNSYNPFNGSTQVSHPLETSFQNLQLSQNSLLPNSTGTYSTGNQQQSQNNPFLKTFTPPISPSPYQYQNIQPVSVSADYSSQISTPQSATVTNPFFRQQQQLQPQPQLQPSMNPFEQAQAGQTMPQVLRSPLEQYHPNIAPVYPEWQQSGASQLPTAYSQVQTPAGYFQGQTTAPYTQSQAAASYTQSQTTTSYTQSQSTQTYTQHVQSPFEQPSAQSYPVTSPYTQPYQSPGHLQPAAEYPFYQQQQQSFPTTSQQLSSQPGTPFRDKNSILALYNQPQYARPHDSTQDQTTAGQDPPVATVKRRSVTMPVSSTSASMNPFANLTNTAMPRPTGEGNTDQRWSGHGRWSPDAFVGLSAKVGGG